MSIKVNHITKLYGNQKALNNVSLSVNSGEIVGLLGPNGAGKSTLMKIITCYIPPTLGKAWICDYDVSEQSLEVRKNIGYLPEHNPLYLDMYVKEYLYFIAGLHKLGKEKDKRIKRMVEITGLQVEQHKKIGALSKGYRQRVGLAQALIHDPNVLILDEPTTGLDPNQLSEIRQLIKEIGKEKTVMLSTHIMQEVKAVCDRVIIIHKGEIVTDALTADLQRTHENIVVHVEFNKNPQLDDLKTIEGVTEVIFIGESSWKIKSNAEKDIRTEIFQFAVKNNIAVIAMKQEEQSLEEVFQKLTVD